MAICGCAPQQKFITVQTYQGPEKPLNELAIIQTRSIVLHQIDGHEPERYLIENETTNIEYHIAPGKHELVAGYSGLIDRTDAVYFGSSVKLEGNFVANQVYRFYPVMKDKHPYSNWYQEDIEATKAAGDYISSEGHLRGYVDAKYPIEGWWENPTTGQWLPMQYGTYQPAHTIGGGIYRAIVQHIGNCVFVAVSESLLPYKAKHWEQFWTENNETLSHVEYMILEGLVGTQAKHTELKEFPGFDSGYKKGWETLNIGELEDARSIFTACINSAKGDITEYVEWSAAFENSGSPELKAEQIIENAEAWGLPKEMPATGWDVVPEAFFLGKAKRQKFSDYLRQQEQKKILEVKERASKLAAQVTPAPKLAELYLNRGVAYQRNGNINEAIEDFRHAIQIHNHYALAYFNRGLCYSKLNNKTRAIEDMNKAKQLAANTNLQNLAKMHRLD